MKILISAAETSSDAHGAELLRAIRAELPPGAVLDAFGIGGPKLRQAGFRVLVDASELLAMGFTEILGRLPQILRAFRAITRAAREEKPDLAIVIDYPDFHFRLAKRLKRLGIPVIYFIPPKIWAWRRGRVRLLRKYFAKVLCIFPFEEDFYRSENVAVKYVGNPLSDELPLELTQAASRQILGLGPSDQVIVLMPGSRPSELKRHTVLMLQAARQVALARPSSIFHVLMPFPLTVSLDHVRSLIASQDFSPLLIHLSQGDAPICMRAANAGLIKSGTSTLEAGLMGCIHAVIYKPSLLTQWIFRYLIRYRGPVGLVNLVAGWKKGEPYLIREMISGEVTPQSLCAELDSLLSDRKRRERISQGLEKLKQEVLGDADQSPSTRAAREVLSLCSGS